MTFACPHCHRDPRSQRRSRRKDSGLPGHFRTYSAPDDSFWCCVGSGMENPTKYGAAIYFHGANSLTVNLYWNVLSPAEWTKREGEIEAEAERRRAEAARLVDELAPGEQQSETDHALVSERSRTGDFRDCKWRDAASEGWFEFRLKVLPGANQVLRCTYWGDDTGREFDILQTP